MPTAEQRAAINADADADIRVIAGAGSGKTFTMTERIIWLITEKRVPAEQILGLTFTRKAAGELLARVTHAVSDRGTEDDPDALFMKPHVATYDAFFQSIVRQYGLVVGIDPSTAPLSDTGVNQLIGNVVGRNLDRVFRDIPDDSSEVGAFSTLVADVRSLSSNIANFMIDEKHLSVPSAIEEIRAWDRGFANRLEGLRHDCGVERDRSKGTRKPKTPADAGSLLNYLENVVERREMLLDLVADYDQAKRAAGMAEYSDFTIAAYQLVVAHPSIGEECRRRYTHVFLDEYQDTSTTQASLLARIFHADREHRSPVTAVGDPRQAIYGWRGASPDAFRFFAERFEAKESHQLSQSHRNPRIILDTANHLTRGLHEGARDRPVDLSPMGDEQGRVTLMAACDLQEEAEVVAEFACHAKDEYQSQCHGRAPVAVLFRSGTNMGVYRAALERRGLHCQVVGRSALLERPDIADLVAVLTVVSDHTAFASLQRLAMSPRFGIGVRDMRMLAEMASTYNARYQHRLLAQAGLCRMAQDGAARRDDAHIRDEVRPYRDSVPVGVTLIDMLMADDLGKRLANAPLSEDGRKSALALSALLHRVEDATNETLEDTILSASRALNLGTDSMVSDHIHGAKPSYGGALWQFVTLARSYEQELPAGLHATLGSFLTWLAAGDGTRERVTALDEHVDAVLMTIHQAKGLEWPAVAVVGMTRRSFPSSQEDGLSITAQIGGDARAAYSSNNVVEYRSECNCWLQNARDVPPQTRVDYDSLPPFPRMTDAALLDFDHFADEYIGQREAYGRRLYDDERRIAYVALTRAQHEALLTCNLRASDDAPDPFAQKTNASPFWLECHGYLTGSGHATTQIGIQGCVADDDAGRRAEMRDRMQRAVAGRRSAPAAGDERAGAWPQRLEAAARASLEASRGAVEDAGTQQDAAATSLLTQTRKLVRVSQDDAEQMGNIVALVNHVNRNRASSPSAIRDSIGARYQSNGPRTLGVARSVLRSVPKKPSRPTDKTSLGNVFHDWARRYLDVQIDGEDEPGMSYRAAMAEDIRTNRDVDPQVRTWCLRLMDSVWLKEGMMPLAAEESLSAWFCGRTVSGGEVRYVGRTVAGTMDAVFAGPLPPEAGEAIRIAGRSDDGGAATCTIVDWKTGRKPTREDDIAVKLVQLDVYRLMLCKNTGKDLDSIDATLYYIDQEREEDRFIVVRKKSAEEIIQEIVDNLYLPEGPDRE